MNKEIPTNARDRILARLIKERSVISTRMLGDPAHCAQLDEEIAYLKATSPVPPLPVPPLFAARDHPGASPANPPGAEPGAIEVMDAYRAGVAKGEELKARNPKADYPKGKKKAAPTGQVVRHTVRA